MTESALKDRIMKVLRNVPDSTWFRPGAGPYGKAGVADILGCVDGLFVAIEVKRPGAYSSPHDGLSGPQRNFLSNIDACGGYTAVIDSIDGAQKVVVELRG